MLISGNLAKGNLSLVSIVVWRTVLRVAWERDTSMTHMQPLRPRQPLSDRNKRKMDLNAPAHAHAYASASRQQVSRRVLLATAAVAVVGTAAFVTDRVFFGQPTAPKARAPDLTGFHTDGPLQPGQAQVLPGNTGEYSKDPATWVYEVRGISPLDPVHHIPRYPGFIQQPIAFDARGRTYALSVDVYGNILGSHGVFPSPVAFIYVATKNNPFGLHPRASGGIALFDNVKMDTEDDDAANIIRVNNQASVATFLYKDVIDGMLRLQSDPSLSWLSPLPLVLDARVLTQTYRYNALVVSIFQSKTNGRIEMVSPIPITLMNDGIGAVDLRVTDDTGTYKEGKTGDAVLPSSRVIMRGRVRTSDGRVIFPLLPENLLGPTDNQNATNPVFNLMGFWQGPLTGRVASRGPR